MFLALILAATTAATPPTPSLASLRVIANVRSTPLCSVMRARVGPAIAALLENDATLDQAPGVRPHVPGRIIESQMGLGSAQRAWDYQSG